MRIEIMLRNLFNFLILPFFKPGIIGFIRDIQNYRSWVKTVKAEKANPRSKWNQYKMQHNPTYVAYKYITLPDETAELPDEVKQQRVFEGLAPINRYLDEDLGFADSLDIDPRVYYGEDGKPTLTYFIMYFFAFKTISLNWILSRITAILITIFLYLFVNWPALFTWISSLI